MTVFTIDQIKNNPMYADVMRVINDLYIEHKKPDVFSSSISTAEDTTTGNIADEHWQPGDIGDWEGNENNAAMYANNHLNAVFAGLKLFGNGGITYYHTTEKWQKFVATAREVIDEYHNSGEAYDWLCSHEYIVLS